MDLRNTKLYVPEDLWEIIQNILIYECGCHYPVSFKIHWHSYLYIDNSYCLTFGDDLDYFKNHWHKEISYKNILNMNNTKKYISVSLEQAREWYKSDDNTLKTLALQVFKAEELKPFDFTEIKTWEDALVEYCKNDNFSVSHYKRMQIKNTIESLEYYSPASAEMFKLNIIRKVLNKDYDLHLTKNANGQSYTWYPYFRFVTKDSTYYDNELKNGEYKKLGKILSEGVTYDVLGGDATYGGIAGLGAFDSYFGVGDASAAIGFLGCATKEIARHFGEYFGMLVMEAMYSDVIKDIKFK